MFNFFFFLENPPTDKVLSKKRKRQEESEYASDFFTRPEVKKIDLSVNASEAQNDDDSKSSKSSTEEDDETLGEKFRRGEKLPSDFEGSGSDSSKGSEDPQDDVDDGEWNMMGAALEREFLGLDDS